MYIWGRGPALDSGEHLQWRAAANRREGARRVAAGWLFITDRRVIFRASRLDRLFGREDYVRLRDTVDTSEVARRDLSDEPFAGGLRRRLALRMTDGSLELFVVWSARRAQRAVATLLSR